MRRCTCLLFVLSGLLAAASAAMGARPVGIDVSHWQGDITQTTWNQAYAGGYTFCWTKGSEGVNYTDPTVGTNVSRGKTAGFYMGVYHFARPTWNTAVAEAGQFVSRCGAYMGSGYLRPVLDLEDGSSLSTSALSTWANAFMNEVERLTGVEPIIYTNTNYATYELDSTVANRTLWIAQYFYTPCPQTCNPSIGIFNAWHFWQYTDNQSVPGFSGGIDGDVHNGTSSTLANYVTGGGTPPPPTGEYICESRSGGLNYSLYSETGTWSSGSGKSTATGVTAGIGHRYCTLDSNAKTAVFRFTPDTTGSYQVYTTNCTTDNSGNPLIHRVSHASGTSNVGACQNTSCASNATNKWLILGTYNLNAGTQYTVTLDGSTGGGSGPLNNAGRSDAIKWVYAGAATPINTHMVESRSGGQNYSLYSETGTWSNGTGKSTASGVTAGIGHRWGAIGSSGPTAVFRFTPTTTQTYKVYTTNCTTDNSGNPMVHKITHSGGTASVGICQNTSCGTNAVNQWLLLGTYTLNGGTQYTVTIDGRTGQGSGPSGNACRSDAIKWEKQ